MNMDSGIHHSTTQQSLDTLDLSSVKNLLETLHSIDTEKNIESLDNDSADLLVDKLQIFLDSQMKPKRYLSRLLESIESINGHFSKIEDNLIKTHHDIVNIFSHQVDDFIVWKLELDDKTEIDDYWFNSREIHRLFVINFRKLYISDKSYYSRVIKKLISELDNMIMPDVESSKENNISQEVKTQCNELKQRCMDVLRDIK